MDSRCECGNAKNAETVWGYMIADEGASDSIEPALNGQRAGGPCFLQFADQARLLSSLFCWRSRRLWHISLPPQKLQKGDTFRPLWCVPQ